MKESIEYVKDIKYEEKCFFIQVDIIPFCPVHNEKISERRAGTGELFLIKKKKKNISKS